MAAVGHQFPDLTPTQRAYTPGVFPQSEFQGLNGAVTTIQYGFKSVDSKLSMTFANITDDEAWQILQNYEAANNGRYEPTGERDFVVLSLATERGIGSESLARQISERGATQPRLRYRYATPPQITSSFPGRSTVQVELRGYLEGASSQ